MDGTRSSHMLEKGRTKTELKLEEGDLKKGVPEKLIV